MAFCRQAKAELLFSFDELHQARSVAVSGRYEPEDALGRLLEGTGFSAVQKGAGRFVVTPIDNRGSIKGRLLGATKRFGIVERWWFCVMSMKRCE